MKKVKKIYGVNGMMEYHAIIKVGGKAHLRVNFTDGSATAMGQMPATYTTDNLMFQHAIEHSADFKSGKIKLIRQIELDEDVEIGSNAVAETNNPTEGEPNAPIEGDGETDGGEGEGDGNEENGEADGKKQVEVTDIEEAREYLNANFGIAKSKILSKKNLLAVAEANGVEFVGLE